MLNAIITGIFSLVAKLGDIIIYPIVALFTATIPSFSSFFSGITSWLGNGFRYIGWFYKALCIPKECMTLVYTVATVSFTLVVGVRVFNLIVRIYNRFKI